MCVALSIAYGPPMKAATVAPLLAVIAACIPPRGTAPWSPYSPSVRPNPGTVDDGLAAAAQVLAEAGDAPVSAPGVIYTAWGDLYREQGKLIASGRILVTVTKASIVVDVQCRAVLDKESKSCGDERPPGEWTRLSDRFADMIVARASGAPIEVKERAVELVDGRACFTRTLLEGVSTVCEDSLAACRRTRDRFAADEPGPCELAPLK
jgi:hypothetical protein